MSAWQDCDTMINLSWEAQGWLWPLFVNIQGTPKGFEEFSNRSWWSPGALSSIDARSDHNHLPRQLSTAFPCHRCDKCGKVFTQPRLRRIIICCLKICFRTKMFNERREWWWSENIWKPIMSHSNFVPLSKINEKFYFEKKPRHSLTYYIWNKNLSWSLAESAPSTQWSQFDFLM